MKNKKKKFTAMLTALCTAVSAWSFPANAGNAASVEDSAAYVSFTDAENAASVEDGAAYISFTDQGRLGKRAVKMDLRLIKQP